MNDKQMLELVAKAYGWTCFQSKHGYWNLTGPEGEKVTCCKGWTSFDPDTGDKLLEPTFADAVQEIDWCPLVDDADAFRLAVKMQMTIRHRTTEVDVSVGRFSASEYVPTYKSREEAARRAITRCAAAIGEAMQ